MDVKKLRYFTHIADVGNMTRASEALRIAQPALTTQIANLEAELGVRLFDRNHVGMRLTPAGDVLYRHARSILRQIEDARHAVIGENQQLVGSVSVGMAGSTGKMLAVPLLQKTFLFAGLKVKIIERPSAELLALVSCGRIDIAIVVDAQPCRGAVITPLLLESLYAILPESERKGRGVITLAELASQPLVLPSFPSTIRQKIDMLLMEAMLPYRVVGEVSSTDMLLRTVIGGIGWTVLPSAAVQAELDEGTISAIALQGHTLSRNLSVCVPDVVPLGPTVSAVKMMLLDIIDELLTNGRWQGVSRITV